MERITSRRNRLVDRFRAAARGELGLLLLDGEHLIDTAIASDIELEDVAVRIGDADSAAAGSDSPLVRRLRARGAGIVPVAPAVFDAISPVRTPSGIAAIARRPTTDKGRLVSPAPAFVIVAVNVQDPGNAGAIVRAADAAAATGVIATVGTADLFGWKALRGSMGSSLRLPVWSGAGWDEVREFLRAERLAVVATSPRAPLSFYDHDWTRPTALLLGAEGQGLPLDVAASADATVAIPMREGVESLNVAVTAALAAYEARRQRGDT